MQATPGAPLTTGAVTATRPRRATALVLIAGLGWLADVVSKVVAVDQLSGRVPVDVVPGVLRLTLTRNSGAAFSLGTGLTVLLTAVACVVVVAVARLVPRVRSAGWALALGLLLGGALGNLTDRLLRAPAPFRGHVVDFLELPHWPVFNVADACIVVAAGVIALQSIRGVALDGSRLVDAADPPSTPTRRVEPEA